MMNENLYKACNEMAKAVGSAHWDALNREARIQVMQLVQLQIIATHLEKIANPLITTSGEPL